MIFNFLKKIYKPLVVSIVLIPNLIVIAFGIESYPYTCAPMFGHYIDDNTNFYIIKFEGINANSTIDLTEYYGKSDDYFIRHFFSKVYGSTKPITPFSSRLTESPKEFQSRMDQFFNQYSSFISKKYNLSFNRINLKIKKVNQEREDLSTSKIIGYFDSASKKYISKYKSQEN